MGPSRPWHPRFSSEGSGDHLLSTLPSFPGERRSCSLCPDKKKLLAGAAHELASLDPSAVHQHQLRPSAGEGQLAPCGAQGGLILHQPCSFLERLVAFSPRRIISSFGCGRAKRVSTPHPLVPETFLKSLQSRTARVFQGLSVASAWPRGSQLGLRAGVERWPSPAGCAAAARPALPALTSACAREASGRQDPGGRDAVGAPRTRFSPSGHRGSRPEAGC